METNAGSLAAQSSREALASCHARRVRLTVGFRNPRPASDPRTAGHSLARLAHFPIVVSAVQNPPRVTKFMRALLRTEL